MRYNLYAQHGCCKTLRAFTLLELLLVIAVIAILIGVILFNLNPAGRLKDASNAQLMVKADGIKKAIEAYALSNNGSMPGGLASLTAYGINDICNYGQSGSCISLDSLVTNGLLSEIPQDAVNATVALSGYKLEYDPQKKLTKIYSTDTYNQMISSQSTLSTGLVGYWKMDEASWTNNCSASTVLDYSGNNNHGKACPNSTGPVGGNLGIYNLSGDFDNVNDYIRVEDSNSLNITNNSMGHC